MQRTLMRFTAPLALGIVLAIAGCDKAKSALESAAGFAPLADADIATIKTDVGWPDTPDTKTPQGQAFANMTILGGVALSDNFPGDLSTTTTIGPIPFSIPDAGKTTAGNQKSLMLVREMSIVVDPKTTYKRLQIISVARYNADSNEIEIDGTSVDQYLDPDQIVSSANNNQAGSYLLIEGKGDKGIQYLSGLVSLKMAAAGSTAQPVDKATVFTTTSPFATLTGKTGKYLLATIQDSQGTALAFKGTIATAGTDNPAAAAPGTPTTATAAVTYTGVLDDPNNPYAVQATAKANEAGSDFPDAQSTIKADYTKANTLVTNFLNAWKVTTINLVFVQPPQAAPAATTTPPPVTPVVQPTAPPAAPPTPPTDPVVERRDPSAPDANLYNVDLGCNGFDDVVTGSPALPVLFDGSKFDNYDITAGGAHGWRATGDVRLSYDNADIIFPTPASGSHYLDPAAGKGNGYCLLTTGDQLYQMNGKQAQYQPGVDGAGQVSEMWQKVHVPKNAKSVQARVAFFSQEFPKFVGSQYNDGFFIKFDESPDVIASGNLNDLAGANSTDASVVSAVQTCNSTVDGTDLTKTCGDWMFTANYKTAAGTALPSGQLWNIENSTQAPNHGDKYGCVPKSGAPNNKCYHGMIAPRIICKNLATTDIDQVRTLRFHVEDAGDQYFDSALAVDSVVFSNDTCDQPAGRMTPEPDSRASEL